MITIINRPLEENEELLGDQIASIFYSPTGQTVTEQVGKITSGLDAQTADLIVTITLSRLQSEQVSRREYLATQLAVATTDPDEVELKFLSLATPSGQPPEVSEQLSYYRTVSLNLLEFELENWQAEHQEMIRALLRQPKQLISELRVGLKQFTNQFYGGGYFQHLELVAVPKNLTDKLQGVGLANELGSRPTIIQKAAFLSYLAQICAVIAGLPEGTGEADALRAVSTVTFNFKEAIEITPTA
ncbi:MAG TPA: hypothetical protein VLE93_00370 [Candidatus Saccharimonadales bacterium]|nr:hypothetical protein [Candidatus Saccharimonadales bacterium]